MRPRKPKKLPVEVSEEEFTKLLSVTKKMHHKVAFLLAWGSGMRVSEVLNVKPNDIDIQKKRIRINQGKGGKDRIVPIPKGFKRKHIDMLPLEMGARALQRAFLRACERSGIVKTKPTIHFHSLRHGFATRLLESGAPINQVQLLMGHSNLSTTSVYTKANPVDALKSYEEYF